MVRRKPHFLKRNRGDSLPQNLLFFDTETKEVRISQTEKAHQLILGWACYWRRRDDCQKDYFEWEFFERKEDFWNFVLSKLRAKTKLYLISHNVVFDFTVCDGFKFLVEHGFKIASFYSEYKSTIINFRSKKGTLMVIDNLNFFRSSLAELGEELGYQKYDIDFSTCSKRELKKYCRRDVEILIKMWIKYLRYLEQNDLGGFGVTVPQQAMKAYTKRFMNAYICIHNSKRALKLEREGYMGGRNECFFIGKIPEVPTYILDVNSMYPYVMKFGKYPRGLVRCLKSIQKEHLVKLLVKSLAIARVKVKTISPCYPYRMGDKLVFPVGTFSTVLCTPELKYALRRGEIVEIKDVAIYKGGYLFSDYVDFFYAQKMEAKERGQRAEYLFSKLMLNSLYGKFGQRGSTWRKVGQCEKDRVGIEEVFYPEEGMKRFLYYMMGEVFEVSREGESYNSFPAISAHVTSYARLHIWGLMLIAGLRNVYYCDTDCLFVNERGLENLAQYVDRKKLGKLSIRATSEKCFILAPKDYILDQDFKRKGLRKDAQHIEGQRYVQEHWATFKTLLYRGDLSTYVIKLVEKTFETEYDKGMVTPSGWVTPFCLEE